MIGKWQYLIALGVVLLGVGATVAFTRQQSLPEHSPEAPKEVAALDIHTPEPAPYKAEVFAKPTTAELRMRLTPLQYQVTQEEGTERPFANEYAENTASGLYVDIVSGETLYSSKDKYDSGTGWPSFVKPISPEVVVERKSGGAYDTRIEIRSRIADSHLGHVFDDGPKERAGKRYCMNSAAMKFIPEADMERLGYAQYLKFVE